MFNALRFLLALVTAASVLSAQQSLTVPKIVKLIAPCVVVIQGKTESGESLGSGFVVSKDGKIVTNLHVIRELLTAKVLVPNGDVFDSLTVLATDERRDLAVVKVAGFNLPTLEIGDSDSLAVGQRLIAVGSPLGLEGTVTTGVLSAIRESDGYRVLQTDAAVNPGNSGGPLVNEMGKVIGVITFKLRATENINFAIPINYVRGLLNNLQQPITLGEMRSKVTQPGATFEQNNNGASLKDTLDWLREKISLASSSYDYDLKGNHVHVSTLNRVHKMESCTIAIDSYQSSDNLIDKDGKTFSGVSSHRFIVPLSVITKGEVKRLDRSDSLNANAFTPHDEVFELQHIWPGFRFHNSFGKFLSGDKIAYYGIFYGSQNTIAKQLEIDDDRITDRGAVLLDYFTMDAPDKQTAEGMVNSVLHAADLCRKLEPF